MLATFVLTIFRDYMSNQASHFQSHHFTYMEVTGYHNQLCIAFTTELHRKFTYPKSPANLNTHKKAGDFGYVTFLFSSVVKVM